MFQQDKQGNETVLFYWNVVKHIWIRQELKATVRSLNVGLCKDGSHVAETFLCLQHDLICCLTIQAPLPVVSW